MIVFGPAAAIPIVGGSAFLAGVEAVPARMSMMSSSAGDGAEFMNDADGSAVTCGAKEPRVALKDAGGRPRISSKRSDALGGRSKGGRFWLALAVALTMKDERGRWTPRAAVGISMIHQGGNQGRYAS